MLVGLLIKRFSALLLPLAVIVLSRLWVPLIDEDPIFAMIGGLFVGVVIGRVRSTAHRGPCSRSRSRPTHARIARRGSSGWPSGSSRETASTPCSTTSGSASTRSRTASTSRLPRFPACRATRGLGSESRWEAILPVVREQAVETAVDIGACEGYFSIMLGEAGIPTIALEGDPGVGAHRDVRRSSERARRRRRARAGADAGQRRRRSRLRLHALPLDLAPPRALLRARRRRPR